MHKVVFLFLLFICAMPTVFGQAEVPRVEVFGGYSVNSIDNEADDRPGIITRSGLFAEDRVSLNGFNASLTGNINRFFGIKGDVSGYYKSDTVSSVLIIDTIGTPSSPPIYFLNKNALSLYNFLGGPVVRMRNSNRVAPFGHLLFGAAYRRVKRTNTPTSSVPPGINLRSSTENEAAFAMALGGGLDVQINNRFDIRVLQADYNPTFFKVDDGNRAAQHNVRLSFGVVFK